MSTKAQLKDSGFADRISFVDVMRGVAVLSMIWMHTADGWLDRSYRATGLWRGIVMFGGLAAPLFFTLAGVGLGLAWKATAQDQMQRRLGSQLRRGLQLVVLGYGLRLQMWMLDAGGYRRVTHWVTAAGFFIAYSLAYRALNPGSARSDRRWLVTLALFGTCVAVLHHTEPARLFGLLRVDVLQGMGLATAIVCAACGAFPALINHPSRLVLVGLTIALASGWVRLLLPGPLPAAVAGYIGTWPLPPGAPTPTLFPVFPWMAYTFAGAGLAIAWTDARETGRGLSSLAWAAVVGAVTAYSVAEVQPWVHAATIKWPHVTQLVRVTYRLSIIAVLAVPAYFLARSTIGRWLRLMGTTSLWIYWVHLELAFGSLARPVSHKLGVGQWLAGFVALSAAMFGLAFAINSQVGAARLKEWTRLWTRADPA